MPRLWHIGSCKALVARGLVPTAVICVCCSVTGSASQPGNHSPGRHVISQPVKQSTVWSAKQSTPKPGIQGAISFYSCEGFYQYVYVHAHVYVYMYVYVYVYVCVGVYVYAYVQVCVYVHVDVYVVGYVHVYVYEYVCVYVMSVHVYVYVYAYVYAYVYVFLYVCMCSNNIYAYIKMCLPSPCMTARR